MSGFVAVTPEPTDLIVLYVTRGGRVSAETSVTSVQDLTQSIVVLIEDGDILFTNLPTSPDGLEAGRLWNNGGDLCIAL